MFKFLRRFFCTKYTIERKASHFDKDKVYYYTYENGLCTNSFDTFEEADEFLRKSKDQKTVQRYYYDKNCNII
jgi:hypothetical protein